MIRWASWALTSTHFIFVLVVLVVGELVSAGTHAAQTYDLCVKIRLSCPWLFRFLKLKKSSLIKASELREIYTH